MSTTTTAPLFSNTARAKTPDQRDWDGYYGYDRPSPLLFNFGRLLQSVVSQAGTYILTGKFHDQDCGIYKCEGGCRIVGKGDLVLSNNCCYWDGGGRRDGKPDHDLNAMAQLITKIVLDWDPMRPIDSMLEAAVSCEKGPTIEALRKVVFKSRVGGVFGGNSLSDFFNWNPFGEAPIKEDYERWCHVHVWGGTEEEIVQTQADRALGKALLAKINAHIRKGNPGSYSSALCCSPRRNGDALGFWINTGRSTQIDGWKTMADIEAFLASDGILVDARNR